MNGMGDETNNLYGGLVDKEIIPDEPDAGIATPEINKGKISDLKQAQAESQDQNQLLSEQASSQEGDDGYLK